MGKKKHRGKAVDKILQESQEKNPTDVLGAGPAYPGTRRKRLCRTRMTYR